MGRPPTSNKRKALLNASKRPLVDDAILEQLCPRVPPAPEDLGSHGKRWWNTTAKLLFDLEILDKKDLTLLMVTAAQVDIMRRAMVLLKTTQSFGHLVETPRGIGIAPAVKMLREATATYATLASALGLTPVERMKLARMHGSPAETSGGFGAPPADDLPLPKNVTPINAKKK